MVGTLSMSLQCICSVPARYTTLCPQWDGKNVGDTLQTAPLEAVVDKGVEFEMALVVSGIGEQDQDLGSRVKESLT